MAVILQYMDHKHKPGATLDYDYIADGIYIGTNQCCASGLAEVLKKEGISADISLEDVRVDQPFGVEMYVWIPTADHTPPSQEQLSFGVKVLDELVEQNRKIYVHCKNGHGRATTLIIAYLLNQGKTIYEAIRLVKEKRPEIHLQDSQQKALETFIA